MLAQPLFEEKIHAWHLFFCHIFFTDNLELSVTEILPCSQIQLKLANLVYNAATKQRLCGPHLLCNPSYEPRYACSLLLLYESKFFIVQHRNVLADLCTSKPTLHWVFMLSKMLFGKEIMYVLILKRVFRSHL